MQRLRPTAAIRAMPAETQHAASLQKPLAARACRSASHRERSWEPMATITHYGTLSSFRFADEASDLRGTLLYGRGDEKLGKIDDVIFDHASGRIRYAVIDTGGWLRHKRFIVPADRIRAYEKHEDHFYADLTKQQIEAFPPYDAGHLES